MLQRTSFHFVRSFWRLRLSWASLCVRVVANGTPVVQRWRWWTQAASLDEVAGGLATLCLGQSCW